MLQVAILSEAETLKRNISFSTRTLDAVARAQLWTELAHAAIAASIPDNNHIQLNNWTLSGEHSRRNF